jgi:hypothetical protein
MNIVLPYNDPWTCSCIKLMPYQASWSKRYVNNEIKNHEKNINQVHPVKNVCSSCTHLCTSTSCNVPKDIIHGMYQSYAFINMLTCASTMQCAKRYHPWNVSIICLYQYANHVHPPICQPCASTNMPNNVSYHS